MGRHGVVAAIAVLTAISGLHARAHQPEPGAALKIVVIEGEGAINIIQQNTAVAPLVEVRDRNDQPVAGAVVNFVVRGGRASFGGARTLTVTTNAAGRAAAAGFAPSGTGALQIGATATFQGQTAAAVTIAQTNVMTAAEAAAASSAAAGGGSSGSSAAGGGAGSGGGISSTTLGVISASAAAAGGIAAANADRPVARVPPPIFTASGLTSTIIQTFTPSGCTNLDQTTMTLTLRLDSLQAPLSGTVILDIAVVSNRGTCPPNETNDNFRFSYHVDGRVSGSPENVTATGTMTQPFTTTTATGTTTDEFAFNGKIVGDEVIGVLNYERRSAFRNTVFNTDGTGLGGARYDVVLRKTQ